MSQRILKSEDYVIWLLFLALAIITPLIFSTKNSELFEVPKMHFVYFAAAGIFFLTIIKFVTNGKILIPKSWPLLALSVFLAFQILSTLTSIDKFTSIFGYPTRLNGGLLSQFAYLSIFASALINLSKDRARQLTMTAIIAALAVSAWGIPGHFGRDPSCLILTGKLTSTCWQKDFDPTLRIFSTLGQPNWLASYLALAIPLSFALAITFTQNFPRLFFIAATLIMFTALIMTNSRAGLAGIALGLIIFLLLQAPAWRQTGFKTVKQNLKVWLILAIGMAAVTAVFGTTLFSRLGEALKSNQSPVTSPSADQLTSPPAPKASGTESGQIRLIVWQGSLKAFSERPIIGWGPETFAYSYYLFRPASHNQTTEWNFFYNKAHNEFLNYLNNIGILGTGAYLIFIASSVWVLAKTAKNQGSIFTSTAIAAILGYQLAIFFGFSTVAPQTLMFLIIAASLHVTTTPNTYQINLSFLREKALKITVYVLVAILGILSLIFVARLYLADLLITRAKSLDYYESDLLPIYESALTAYPISNPFYLADFAYDSALVAQATGDQDLSQRIDNLAQQALGISPNNVPVIRRAATAYFLISDFDEKYQNQALILGQKLTRLAPTDPQSYLTLAKIQAGTGQEEEAQETLGTALELKPDYQEAQELLEQLGEKEIQ